MFNFKKIETYKSIDEIPLYNWNKITSGEIEYIKKNLNEKLSDKKLNIAYEILNDDYLDKKGLGLNYKRILDLMKKKAIAECDFAITKNTFKLTEIELYEYQISEKLKDDKNGMSIEKTLVYLSKWLGYRIDSKQITLSEYYIIIEEYGKAN